MTIIRGTLVAIFAKPGDDVGMTVPIRCVDTAEELAEYDAELAQDAQRQTGADATHAHIARVCLAHLGAVLQHCDAARGDSPPMLTCTNTVRIVRDALTAREATKALAKRTRDSGAPSALTTPPPPTSVATDATLGKVDGILLTANYCIYRQHHHANTAAAPRAAAPRGVPTAP